MAAETSRSPPPPRAFLCFRQCITSTFRKHRQAPPVPPKALTRQAPLPLVPPKVGPKSPPVGSDAKLGEVVVGGGASTAGTASASSQAKAEAATPATPGDAAGVAEPDLRMSASRIASITRRSRTQLLFQVSVFVESGLGVFERFFCGSRCIGRTSDVQPGQ